MSGKLRPSVCIDAVFEGKSFEESLAAVSESGISAIEFWGWWDKLSEGNGNVNNVTSSALTDLGGGGTFYDCRVEVERWEPDPRPA